MSVSHHTARQVRELHLGRNWTAVNMKAVLADVSWEDALRKPFGFNSIASLTYHTGYYIRASIPVLTGGPLEDDDAFAFDHPSIASQEDWEKLRDTIIAEGVQWADLIEQFPEDRLWEIFSQEFYGTFFRNFHGIAEHAYYHLGQIVLIKKLLAQSS